MALNMKWPEAIKKVLSESPVPLHYNEITNQIIAQSLRTSLGATPSATVNATMNESIKHDGDNSPYVRVERGVFTLRTKSPGVHGATAKLTPDVTQSEEIEDQYEVITSFGMF